MCAQKLISRGADWAGARQLLVSHGLVVAPVTPADTEIAASLWKSGEGLSLADRLCLALAARLDARVWTADTQWRGRPGVTLIR